MTTPELKSPGLAQGLNVRRLQILLCVAVAILAAITFFPALFGGWAPFDDEVELIDLLRIRAFTAENLAWMFTDTQLTLRYTPFSWITWAIVYKFTGASPPSPLPFHVLGVLCHVINAGLVCWLLMELLGRWERLRQPEGTAMSLRVPIVSALGAAVWTVHPLRVEVASWATQVRFAEAQIWAVLSLLLYLRSVDRNPLQPMRTGAFWGSVALYCVSILYYPSVICLPLVLPFLDVYLLRRPEAATSWRGVWRVCLEKWPYFPVAVLVGLLTIHGRAASAAGFWGAPATLADFPIPARFMQACYVMMYFVWKPLDPTHLSPVYSDLMEFYPWAPRFIVSAIFFVGISIAAWVLRKKWPWLLVAWAAHVIILLPVSGVMDRDFIPCDRYSYFHDIICVAMLGGVALWLWPRATGLVQKLVPAVAIAVVLAFAVLSRAQTQVWRDPYLLFDHIFAELGEDPFRKQMYWQRAHWFFRDRRPWDAIEDCDRALAMDNRLIFARTIRGDSLVAMATEETIRNGPTERARALFFEAARNADALNQVYPNPDNLEAAGLMYLRAGDSAHAEERLREAKQSRPGDMNVRLTLAGVLYRIGKQDAAMSELDEAQRIAPGLAAQREQILESWKQSAATGTASAPATQGTGVQ